MTHRQNIHATGVVLGRSGVLIQGPSGSGKTTLALQLLRRAREDGLYAGLVADDQLYLSALSGRLVMTAPEPISGLVEIYGLGPVQCAFASSAIADLVVSLAPSNLAPRYQEPGTATIAGIPVPQLTLPERSAEQAAFVVFAHLRTSSFAGMRQNG